MEVGRARVYGGAAVPLDRERWHSVPGEKGGRGQSHHAAAYDEDGNSLVHAGEDTDVSRPLSSYDAH